MTTDYDEHAWNTPLCCGCCNDCGVCCYGCWCTACLYGEMIDALYGGGCFLPCLFACCFRNLTACFQAAGARSAMHAKLGDIPEGCCGPCHDCCVACFVFECMICQMKRELNIRGLNGSECIEKAYIAKQLQNAQGIEMGVPVPQKMV